MSSFGDIIQRKIAKMTKLGVISASLFLPQIQGAQASSFMGPKNGEGNADPRWIIINPARQRDALHSQQHVCSVHSATAKIKPMKTIAEDPAETQDADKEASEAQQPVDVAAHTAADAKLVADVTDPTADHSNFIEHNHSQYPLSNDVDPEWVESAEEWFRLAGYHQKKGQEHLSKKAEEAAFGTISTANLIADGASSSDLYKAYNTLNDSYKAYDHAKCLLRKKLEAEESAKDWKKVANSLQKQGNKNLLEKANEVVCRITDMVDLLARPTGASLSELNEVQDSLEESYDAYDDVKNAQNDSVPGSKTCDSAGKKPVKPVGTASTQPKSAPLLTRGELKKLNKVKQDLNEATITSEQNAAARVAETTGKASEAQQRRVFCQASAQQAAATAWQTTATAWQTTATAWQAAAAGWQAAATAWQVTAAAWQSNTDPLQIAALHSNADALEAAALQAEAAAAAVWQSNGAVFPFNGAALPFNGATLPFNGAALPFDGAALPYNANQLGAKKRGGQLESRLKISGLPTEWTLERAREFVTLLGRFVKSVSHDGRDLEWYPLQPLEHKNRNDMCNGIQYVTVHQSQIFKIKTRLHDKTLEYIFEQIRHSGIEYGNALSLEGVSLKSKLKIQEIKVGSWAS